MLQLFFLSFFQFHKTHNWHMAVNWIRQCVFRLVKNEKREKKFEQMLNLNVSKYKNFVR